jgi:hypothetical protein
VAGVAPVEGSQGRDAAASSARSRLRAFSRSHRGVGISAPRVALGVKLMRSGSSSSTARTMDDTSTSTGINGFTPTSASCLSIERKMSTHWPDTNSTVCSRPTVEALRYCARQSSFASGAACVAVETRGGGGRGGGGSKSRVGAGGDAGIGVPIADARKGVAVAGDDDAGSVPPASSAADEPEASDDVAGLERRRPAFGAFPAVLAVYSSSHAFCSSLSVSGARLRSLLALFRSVAVGFALADLLTGDSVGYAGCRVKDAISVPAVSWPG